jgi:hypothetical protein
MTEQDIAEVEGSLKAWLYREGLSQNYEVEKRGEKDQPTFIIRPCSKWN